MRLTKLRKALEKSPTDFTERTDASRFPASWFFCFFKIAASLVLIAGAGAVEPTFAQSAEPQRLTILRPDDPQFEDFLSSKYPGFQDLDRYSTLRPFLLIIQNTSSHWVSGYAIDWEIATADGMLHEQPYVFLKRTLVPRETQKALPPGAIQLIAPTFAVTPTDYSADIKSVTLFPTSIHPYTFKNIQSVRGYLEGVVYDDGAYTGRNPAKLLARYVALNQAQRDLGAHLLGVIDKNTSQIDALGHLNDEARNQDSFTGEDSASLYKMERFQEAQNLSAILRTYGAAAVRDRASKMSRYSPARIWPLSQPMTF